MDVLSTFTKYTQENLDEEIKELCKNYPQYRFMLYYKIMTTLQQIGNNDLLEKYYQEINTCIPMNEEQKDLLEVIKEIFGIRSMNMKKDLYLMRHGQTLFNLRRKIQGWCDSPLTDFGIEQAKAAGEYFKEIELDHLYCSTAER